MIDTFRKRMEILGGYEGEFKRANSQKIMDVSWMRDAATKPVYVKWVNKGLPMVEDDDVPVYAKFNVKSYHNITGDEIAYLLQFRLEDMKSNPNIKVGSYVQIKNEFDEPEWWLIWHLDDRTSFRQFSVVKCTHVYRWLSWKDGKRIIHECLACPRNQNSYNSGVWLDHVMQVVENQHVMVMPTNDDSVTIAYDTKFLISEPGRYPPLAWKISKIAPGLNGDITKFTMVQEMFDPARDNTELMIADYWDSYVEPELPELEETPTVSAMEITYSGLPAVRAGGGYKKFTLKERIDGKLVDVTADVEWNIDFADGDPTKLVCSIQDNVIKIKCMNDYSLIGKTFTINAELEYGKAALKAEVISL